MAPTASSQLRALFFRRQVWHLEASPWRQRSSAPSLRVAGRLSDPGSSHLSPTSSTWWQTDVHQTKASGLVLSGTYLASGDATPP